MARLDELINKRKQKIAQREVVADNTQIVVPSSGVSIRKVLGNHYKKKYDKTKLERTNKYELILPETEPTLFNVQGKLAESYTHILKEIGTYDKIIEKDPNFDFNYFDVDMGGCDKRIMDLIPNYLDKHIIIVSPHQKNMSILRNNYSFLRPLLRTILDGKVKDTIAAITPHEPVYGELESGLELLIKQLNFGASSIVDEGYFEVKLNLDTPTNAIKKISELRKTVLEVFGDNEGYLNILDYELEDKIVKSSQELIDIYGNITKLIIGEDSSSLIEDIFPLKLQTNSYKYSTDEIDIYSFKNSKYIFIYFDKGEKTVHDNFIDSKRFLVLNGNESGKLLDFLKKQSLIDYNLNEFYIDQTLKNIEKTEFKKYNSTADKDVTNGFSGLTKKQKNNIPDVYYELQQISEDLKNRHVGNEALYMKNKSVEAKLALLFPKEKDPLIYEILGKLSKEETLMKYTWDTTGFKEEFMNAEPKQQKETLKQVMSNIIYQHQYNLSINSWLHDNYKPLCDELKVNFVKKDI